MSWTHVHVSNNLCLVCVASSILVFNTGYDTTVFVTGLWLSTGGRKEDALLEEMTPSDKYSRPIVTADPPSANGYSNVNEEGKPL